MKNRGKKDFFHTCEIVPRDVPNDPIVELHHLLCRIARITASRICFGGGGRQSAYVKTGQVMMQITIQKHSIADYKELQKSAVCKINSRHTTLGGYTYRTGFGNE